MANTVVILSSGSSWTVPSDFQSLVKIEALGGAGGGFGTTSATTGSNEGGGSGGGGAYAILGALSLTIGQVVPYHIGQGGAGKFGGSPPTNDGEDTWFKDTGTLKAKGGSGATAKGFGTWAGGAAAACIPTLGAHSGGNGTGSGSAGSGGGGAGNANADGSNGVAAVFNGPGGNGGNAAGPSGGSGGAGSGSGAGSPGTAGATWTGTSPVVTTGPGGGGGGGRGGGAASPGGAGAVGGGGGGGGSSFGSQAAGGAGGNGIIVITYTPASAPAAPTNLAATAGNGSVSLSWTASSGATSYKVYRSLTSGTETVLASGITSTSYNDTGLANGTRYFYTVTAVGTGESSQSSEVSAVPVGSPITAITQPGLPSGTNTLIPKLASIYAPSGELAKGDFPPKEHSRRIADDKQAEADRRQREREAEEELKRQEAEKEAAQKRLRDAIDRHQKEREVEVVEEKPEDESSRVEKLRGKLIERYGQRPQ